jgi:DNA-binding MarR family transcriptional regulator
MTDQTPPSDGDPNAELTQYRQNNIGRLFLRAHRDFSERSIAKLQQRGHNGLSLVHTNLLIHLDTEGTRITTLAERAGITKQAMGNLVAELEQHGYVSRSSDPNDRRASIVHFTQAGWQFLHDAQAVKQEIEDEYRQLLGEPGFQQLRSLLENILTN